MKLKRILRYISFHLYRNPRYLFVYAINYFNPNFIPDVKYHPTPQLAEILKEGKSLIRIGDGEVHLMNGNGIGYQKYDPLLKEYLFKIIKEYDQNSPYMIGLNKIPISKSNKTLRRDQLLNCWMPMKSYFAIYFDKNLKYFDATAFYYNETFPEYLESYLKTRHLVLVTRAGNIEKFQNNKSIPFTEVSFVATPAEDAFSEYERIKNETINEVGKFGKDKVVVLAACGPASKPLAYELAKENIVTIDVGRGIEVAYTNERIDHIIYPDLKQP